MSGTTSSAAPPAASTAPASGGLPTLPPQYSTGNLGFFTRQTEAVPTSVTVGPDGALYVGVLTGIPYADGYAYVARIANPSATTGFDGATPSGVPQVYASGFGEVQSISFNNSTGDMYVLEYINSNEVYDPTQNPNDLPPSKLIQVAPDGTRTTISGPELHLGNYVLVNQKTGDVYVAINNDGPGTATGPGTGEVLDYHQDPSTGAWSSSVIASGLNNPRGMAFGPDGNLYVLEQGTGTPSGAPGADTAPTIPFIPGQVSERFGYTGSITRVDITGDGSQQRIYTGLPSFREFNPTTGQDRVISIGANAMTIAPDGTVYIASGGGLAPQTAAALGSAADGLQGVLKLTGLFGPDPSQATWTPEFNALSYAAANGPDGATTQFNTESNLYDITQGPDGQLYTADAARNDVYGLSSDGTTVNSATVLQKQPPILTPPQYAAVVAAGGNPSQQYAAEIANYTFKGPDNLPNVPGNIPAAGAASSSSGTSAGPPTSGGPPTPSDGGTPGPATTGTSGTTASPPPNASGTATSAASTDASGSAGTMGASSATASTGASTPPHGEDATGSGAAGATTDNSGSSGGSGSSLPTLPTGAPSSPFPGPTDPTSPPVLANNPYSPYFNPFFGNFAPAPSTPLALPDGSGGTYTVSNLVVFGDRLADNGNALKLAESLGQGPDYATAPYSPTGDFSDGPKWTTDLAQILGATQPSQQQNFAFEDATARDLGVPNPFDPNASQTPLDTFAGQIQQFQQQGGSFSPNDLVSVTFGGNDISLPSTVSPDQGITLSVNAILSGLQQLADLGAKHFLVSDLPDITLAPLFNEPAFQQATGATPAAFQGLVDDFNSQLSAGLAQFKSQTGLDVKELDLNALFKGIAANPSDYGVTNISQPVLANPPGSGVPPTYNPAIVGQDPQVEHGSLFIDPYFDPTALGQSLIAQTARSTLTA